MNNKIIRLRNMFCLFFFIIVFAPLNSQTKNGFDLSNSIVDPDEIYYGGPPPGGIPAISNPTFINNEMADYLKDDDMIIGVIRSDVYRAYPWRILSWHEIVNDSIDNEYFVVTYCPLCGTAMVFDRHIKGVVREFAVSGLLHESDVLLYDLESNSLWSQLAMKSISGVETGTPLRWMSSVQMKWKTWKERYPNGKVLSTETSYKRDYNTNAYAAYELSKTTMFPVSRYRDELKEKEKVIGIIVRGKAKAYPLNSFTNERPLKDTIEEETIFISYNETSGFVEVKDINGNQINFVTSYWFAWQAFYPNTYLWISEF